MQIQETREYGIVIERSAQVGMVRVTMKRDRRTGQWLPPSANLSERQNRFDLTSMKSLTASLDQAAALMIEWQQGTREATPEATREATREATPKATPRKKKARKKKKASRRKV